MQTPVVFIIFNRPDTTERVFAEIAKAKPAKLLVIADGPRTDNPGEAEKCKAARAVVERVDWDCEVLKNYSNINMGCEHRVSSGLTWVFEQVEEAIILEDDCLPHPTFFRFCTELLEKYREDERIAMISGNNFQLGHERGSASYYFSIYPLIWGWATWRRDWQSYNKKMSQWPNLRTTNWLNVILKDKLAVQYWSGIFDKAYKCQIDAWCYKWIFACWVKQTLIAMPNINLVANIGFGPDATHTKNDIYGIASIPTRDIDFPLRHPLKIIQDREADHFTFTHIFAKEIYQPTLYRRIGRALLSILPNHLQEAILTLRENSR